MLSMYFSMRTSRPPVFMFRTSRLTIRSSLLRSSAGWSIWAENEEITRCITGADMAKKHISSVDLSWLISEEVFEAKGDRSRPSLAVVPDEKDGWRVIVGNTSRRYWTAADQQRLDDIQRRLRSIYQIQS